MNKIYCKSCAFYRNSIINLCVHPNEHNDTPISPKGKYKWTDCLVKNKNYDCSDYQKEKVEEVKKVEPNCVLKFIRSLKW